MSSVADIVLFCACKHKPPQNEVCQYVPGHSCGGSAKCPICQGVVVGVDPEPPAVPPVTDAVQSALRGGDPDGFRATAEYRAGQMPTKLG